MSLFKFLDKLGWKFYDFCMRMMDKHASPRPISREEMDKIQKRYEDLAKEHPDQVITEKDK